MSAADGPARDDTLQALALSFTQSARLLHASGLSGQALLAGRCAVALARQAGDNSVLCEALVVLSMAEWGAGNCMEQGFAHAQEALALAPGTACVALHCDALLISANLHSLTGSPGRAAQMCQEVVRRWRAAFGPAPNRVVAKALQNLGCCLGDTDLEDEAVEAFEEARSTWAQLPGEHAMWLMACCNLSLSLQKLGAGAAAAGRHVQAQNLLQRAVQVLPPLDLTHWRLMGLTEAQALLQRALALCALDQVAQARRCVCTLLRIARLRKTHGLLISAHLGSLTLHAKAHQDTRALRSGQRLLAGAAGTDPRLQMEGLQLLAGLHARRGEFAQALAHRRRLVQLQRQHDASDNALRCRIAALERRTEKRRLADREALLHVGRLSVIGRLIAQTHHALHGPIQSVGQLCAQALDTLRTRAPAAALGELLQETIARIDRAAALTQQLKLYSYRSTPQHMALSLRHALGQARSGIALHVPGGADRVSLAPDSCSADEVWADPQRLGILLKVLLIELLALPRHGRRPGQLSAQVDSQPDGTVALVLDATDATVTDALPSMGATLCMEIAREMSGALVDLQGDDGLVRYRLSLRAAHATSAPPQTMRA